MLLQVFNQVAYVSAGQVRAVLVAVVLDDVGIFAQLQQFVRALLLGRREADIVWRSRTSGYQTDRRDGVL